MGHEGPAVHRTIVVVDVERFCDHRRTRPDQLAVRTGLYRALEHAFEQAGLPWAVCDHEDRGDAVFVRAPAQLPKAPFVDVVPRALVDALRVHNSTHRPEERIRARMAVHAGEIAYDEHGVTATAVNLTFRLLDARPLKTALAESPGILALITSGWFFDEVVRHSRDTDPTTFRRVPVVVRETSTVGWISLPDHPYPSDPTVLTALVSGLTALVSGHHHPTEPVPQPMPQPVPHQLPALPRSFTGRAGDLATLTAVLDDPAADGGPVVSAIVGTGGVGKTWLALRWAHQHVDRFPDGQLFVDLRGFSPDDDPMPPGVALRGFLEALGVEPGRIPVDPHAQAGLYRSLVAGRRMLVVLDNAADTAQVAPLLPGTPTCTVLVTSRNTLSGLVTGHGAHHLALDVLSKAEANALLATRIGADRADAEPAAVNELVRMCGGCPLALSILAARAHTHPHIPLAALVTELREAGPQAWDDDDPAASLPAVFSWSYRALSDEQARAFGLLGIAPGPHISLAAAASLTGLPDAETRAVLRGLEQASLLNRDETGRYRMHDLIRQFATGHAYRDITPTDQAAALRRIIDFYLHTANIGERLLCPHRPPIELDPPQLGCRPHPLGDATAALAWFDTEHPCLLATQNTAAIHNHHQAVWQLAWALSIFHYRRGRLHDRLAVCQVGLAAVNHLSDRTTDTHAHRNLGTAYAQVGRHDKAIDHLHQALTLAERNGDHLGQARTHQVLAWTWGRRGDDQQALTHATQALRLCRTIDITMWEADTLNLMGWYAARLGEYETAREHCQTALALHRSHHNLDGEAATLDSFGYLAYRTGHYNHALHCYHQALTMHRDLCNSYSAANTLDRLGRTHRALGHPDKAHAVWREAVELYQAQQRTDDASRVQRQLADLVANRECQNNVS